MRAARFRRGAGQVGGGRAGVIGARVASAHEGSAETAQRMIEAAFKMGADAIQFQIFRSELLVVRRHPGRRNLDAVELSAKEWRGGPKAAQAPGPGPPAGGPPPPRPGAAPAAGGGAPPP